MNWDYFLSVFLTPGITAVVGIANTFLRKNAGGFEESLNIIKSQLTKVMEMYDGIFCSIDSLRGDLTEKINSVEKRVDLDLRSISGNFVREKECAEERGETQKHIERILSENREEHKELYLMKERIIELEASLSQVRKEIERLL